MVKITPENVASKLGKRVDLKTTTELSLPNKQIDDISSFANFVSLEKVDLSGNWFKFTRHIEGIFTVPKLKELNFSGCPVTKVANYRYFVIANCPLLEVLDNQPVTDEERDKALRLASGKEDKPVFDPLMNPSEDEEEKRKEALEAEKVRVQQEKKEREEEKLKEKQAKEEKEKTEREQFMKVEGERLKQEKKEEEERTRAEEEALARREKEQQAKLEKEKKEKEAAKKAEEEKKKAEAIKHAPIIEEKTVFKDDRSSMVITAGFSDFGLSDEPKKKKPEAKKSTLFDDDSLFGSSSSVSYKKDKIDFNLNEEDDILNKLSTKSERKPVTAKIEENDLFSTNSKSTTTNKFDDDLFSLVDNKSSKSALDSDDFNFDDYIAKQKVAAKSGGGLFD